VHPARDHLEISLACKEISTNVSFIRKPVSKNEILQRRLLILAAAFLWAYNLALTFSNVARYHTWTVSLTWQNWIGFAIWLVSVAFLEAESNRLQPDHNPYLLPIIGTLSGWGLVTIWRLDTTLGIRQTIWLAVGSAAMWICFRFPNILGILRKYKYLWLTGGILLTALTFFFGTYPAGEGPRLWLGFAGVYLQPSELLKLLLIIFLAAYLADRIPVSFNFLQLILPTLLLFLVALFVLLAQRDLGTASLFIVFYIVMVYLAVGKKRLLLLAGAFLGVAGVLGYRLFSIVQVRVNTWINPWLDPSGISYQIIQSLIGVAAGGVFGRGPGLGSPGIIPVAHSDFIFSAIAEETGMAGTFALFALLAVLAVIGLRIALNANNQFKRFLAAGIIVYTVLQSILIIGGNLRLFPLTGVTLPFISYGGSSLLTSFISAALLLIIGQDIESENPLPVRKIPYQVVGSFLLAGIVALSLTNGWWAFIRSTDLQTRSDNPRHSIGERYVQRGSIVDRDNNPIVITLGTSGDFHRSYLHPAMSAVTGYDDPLFGQAGVEAAMNDYLEGIKGNPSSTVWLAHFLYGQTPQGLDVRLSIDLSIQQLADKLLNGHSGGIVVLNPDTGEILGMSSQPSIDPNQMSEKGSEWLNDPSSPFLNRATQAQYPVGNALGPFLLSSYLDKGYSLSALPSEMTGYLNGRILTCAIPNQAITTWGQAIADGCPAAVLTLADELGNNGVLNSLSNFRLNTSPDFILPVSSTSQVDLSTGLPTVLLGDSQVVSSPLQMAIASAVISNNGYVVSPRLVTAYRSSQYGWVTFALTGKEQISSFNSTFVVNDLASTAISGWETIAVASSIQGKVTWFLAGTMPDWHGNPVVVVVALEENNPLFVQQIGWALFNQATLP
jgi:cell division protein FtsW (lipid II flippase)